MARLVKRISDLPEAAPIQGDELLEMVQNGENVKVDLAAVRGDRENEAYSAGSNVQISGGVISATDTTYAPATSSADGLMSKEDKVKLNGIATGATKNATDAELRNRATHTGTQAISTVSGLQAALDSKVDKVSGKQLSTEDFTSALKDKLTGLEGTHWRGSFVSLAALQAGVTNPAAGDYADVDAVGADVERYIWDATDSAWVVQSGAVAPITASQVKQLYESNHDTNAFTDAEKGKLGGIQSGAQVNTVTSVNSRTGAVTGLVENTDPRLTDAREWTATTVSQAEAEAGTGTTRRAWTAQRVRQAITAWWNTIGTAFGKTLLGSADAGAARQNLGLGTAATRNVGTGSGNVMEVGAFGLGSSGSNLPTISESTVTAANTSFLSGPGDGHVGWANGYGQAILFKRNTYHATIIEGSVNKLWFQNMHAGTLNGWNEILHTSNILTTTGQSTKYPMTQKAVTDAINTKVGLSGNQTIAGVKTFSSFPVTPSAAPTANYQAANKKYVDDMGEMCAKWVSGNKIITVADSGADFTTVMDAIAEAMKWRSIDGSVIVEIQSGYLVQEQLFFIDNDYSHINIRAQNGATITVDHNSMSVTDFEGLGYSGFIVCARGKSPMFQAQFEFLTRPANTISGAMAVFNGEIYFGNNSGVKGAGHHGASGYNGGSVTMGDNNDFSDAGQHGALSYHGGSVTMGDGNDFSGAGANGASGYNGGSVTMGDNNNFSGVAVGRYSLLVKNNGFIQAGDGTIFTVGRERSQAPRTITTNGLIMG